MRGRSRINVGRACCSCSRCCCTSAKNSNYKIWKVPAGGTFNLATRPTAGFHTVSVTAGALSRAPY
jgi:hypothetical protein